MDLSKLEINLWRLFKIIILLCCIGGGLFVIRVLFGKDSKKATPEFKVAKENDVSKRLRLGSFDPLTGTNLTLAALGFGSDRYSITSDDDDGYIVNYFLVDNLKKEGQWLWKKSEWKVHRKDYIFDSPNQEKKKAIGLLFELYSLDTNKDGKINKDDKRSLLYYDLRTRTSSFIKQDIEKTIGFEQTNDSEFFVYFTNDQRTYFMAYDIKTKKTLEKEIELPE